MKNSGWMLFLTALVLSAMLAMPVWSAPSRILGDVDQNGALNSADARIMLRYMVGGYTLTLHERQLADCDGNNRIDTRDARYVLNAASSNETPSTLPTTTTTAAPTTTTTRTPIDDEGYYDDIVKP